METRQSRASQRLCVASNVSGRDRGQNPIATLRSQKRHSASSQFAVALESHETREAKVEQKATAVRARLGANLECERTAIGETPGQVARAARRFARDVGKHSLRRQRLSLRIRAAVMAEQVIE